MRLTPLIGGQEMLFWKIPQPAFGVSVGKSELLDHPNLEVDGEAGLLSFGEGTSDLLGTRVNAAHMARCANTPVRFHRQHAGAVPYIQHRFSGLKLSQVGGPLRKLSQRAT